MLCAVLRDHAGCCHHCLSDMVLRSVSLKGLIHTHRHACRAMQCCCLTWEMLAKGPRHREGSG